ncbi:MAG: hypothetical protein M1830_010857 [Pleopsidium flavum]|nr:MAG: hypothetical protein M1830_010857 [Pleopsidium flavum]
MITSCQSIAGPSKDADQSSTNSEATLDDVKSIYAARLAICEIVGAGTVIPNYCAPLMASDQTKSKRGFRSFLNQGAGQTRASGVGYDDIKGRQLGQCLKSLESRPQWWTSYSNNRQNAVVMCQAARGQIEKDEMLDLHRSMAGVNSEMNSLLSKTVDNAHLQLRADAKFADAVKTFQTQLLHDLRRSNAEAQTYFEKLMQAMDAVAQTVIGKISTTARAVELDVQGLGLNIRKSNSEVIDLQKNVGRVFQEVLSGSSELAATQVKEAEVNRGLIMEVRSSLETIRGRELETLLQALGSMHRDLQISNEMVATMHLRQNSIDERLLSLDNSFEKLESKAEALHAAQTVQAELQLRLHESLATGMHVTNGLVDQVRASTAYLQNTVEDTSAKVAQMANFSGFATVIFKWSWAILVILAVSLYSGKAASYVARCFGVALLTELMGLPERLLRRTTDILPFGSPATGSYQLQASSARMISALVCSAFIFLFGCAVYGPIQRWRRLRLNQTTILGVRQMVVRTVKQPV